MEQQVGPFLDKIKNLAREAEWVRLQPNQCTRLYISNIRARTKEDIISKLKQLGVNIRQDDRAKFEVKYSKKLRLETAALSVLVEPNSQLLDLLTGTQRVDGIMGPASFTITSPQSDQYMVSNGGIRGPIPLLGSPVFLVIPAQDVTARICHPKLSG